MSEFSLDNGWVIKKNGDKPAILHVIPVPNSIFRDEDWVEIPDTIYREIEAGERRVGELAKKHNLYDFVFQWESRSPVRLPTYQNTPTKYYGKGFLATEEDGSYYLTYELAMHGGGLRKIPITKQIYDDARKGTLSKRELFAKYNLHRFDLPEYDVK